MKKLVLSVAFALTMVPSAGFSQAACYGVAACNDYCVNNYGKTFVCGRHQVSCTAYGRGCSWKAFPDQGVNCTGNDEYGNWASWTYPAAKFLKSDGLTNRLHFGGGDFFCG